MTDLIVCVRVPRSAVMTANQRGHWTVRARKSRTLRQLAAIACQGVPPLTTRQHVTCEVTYPSRGVRDPLNVAPTVKALIDGMVTDGGLLPDDSDEWLIGPDIRKTKPAKSLGEVVLFTFTFKEA